jgi:RHS repeat-associated protein
LKVPYNLLEAAAVDVFALKVGAPGVDQHARLRCVMAVLILLLAQPRVLRPQRVKSRLLVPAKRGAAGGSSIAPGANATFSFNVTAPTSPGTYNFQWKMVQDGVEWFGAQSANVAVKVGVNDAAFVSQNVPPIMTPGQSYAVSVTMNNSGGNPWSSASGHKLGTQNPQDNNLWTGSPRVALPGTIALGANAVFSFNVTAPSTPGTYNFQWKMVQDGVEWFGAQSANAAIKVGLDNAAFVSQNVPSTMAAGQSYAVSVTMQNTGSTTWAAGTVGLGSQNPQGNTTWGTSKINLASPVAPGAQTTFNFNVTAPSSPGTYNFQWRMLEGSNGWFGAQTTNVAVVVAGTAPDANVFFIHVDHLNTPRLVANAQGQTVWRWDQAEPFGVNPADENPSGLGVFDLPLRLPGQYFDKETNLHYNYFRDYDPVIGRYAESDPIGLKGGLNTYLYVRSAPLLHRDFFGLREPPGRWPLESRLSSNVPMRLPDGRTGARISGTCQSLCVFRPWIHSQAPSVWTALVAEKIEPAIQMVQTIGAIVA